MTYCPCSSWRGSPSIQTVATTTLISILSPTNKSVRFQLRKEISRNHPISLLYSSCCNRRVAPGSAVTGPASCRPSAGGLQHCNGWRPPSAVRRSAREPGNTLRVGHAPIGIRIGSKWRQKSVVLVIPVLVPAPDPGINPGIASTDRVRFDPRTNGDDKEWAVRPAKIFSDRAVILTLMRHAAALACSWSGQGQNRSFQRRCPDQPPVLHRSGMARVDAPPAGGTGPTMPVGFHCKTPVQPTTVTEVRGAR
jgi:hypothetical protein